jgi:alpha-L-rhamnosidase
MGDAALTVNEALYNFDLVKFYLNFLNLIGDVQRPNGEIPDYVPGEGYNPDPNWGTALPTITWQLYKHTGDSSILETYYNSVRAYVEYVRGGYNKTGLVDFFCKYGDWVPPPPHPQSNRHLISSFAFLHDVNVLLNMSQILEKTSDTTMYTALYNQLTEEFHRVFYNTTSKYYADGMQAAQVLALALPGVVPENVRGAVVDYLATDISGNGNHVTTGIVSNAQIYPVLSDNGHHDLALQLVTSITYPSYGYMFNNPYENATTVWELWDTPSEGPGMNSRNHHMYAAVGAWFYSHLAGIELSPDMITVRPRMASEANKHLMKKLDGQLSTLYGLVHVSYTRDERDTIANSILLRVTIPPNARARVMFEPLFVGGQCATLIESNKVIWSSDVGTTNHQGFGIEKDPATGLMTVHVGSGQYEFQALWK